MTIQNCDKVIVITRPYDQAVDFLEDLTGRSYPDCLNQGYKIVPMLDIKQLSFRMPRLTEYDGLIFTSSNSLRCFGAKLFSAQIMAGANTTNRLQVSGDIMDKPIYVVGSRTERLARSFGFRNISVVALTVLELVRRIKQHIDERRNVNFRLLYVRGKDISYNLENDFKDKNVSINSLMVYAAPFITEFPDDFLESLDRNRVLAVTFFSARTAENFVNIIRRRKLLLTLKGIEALCISRPVYECVQPFWGSKTFVARSPNREGMMLLVKERFDAYLTSV